MRQLESNCWTCFIFILSVGLVALKSLGFQFSYSGWRHIQAKAAITLHGCYILHPTIQREVIVLLWLTVFTVCRYSIVLKEQNYIHFVFLLVEELFVSICVFFTAISFFLFFFFKKELHHISQFCCENQFRVCLYFLPVLMASFCPFDLMPVTSLPYFLLFFCWSIFKSVVLGIKKGCFVS